MKLTEREAEVLTHKANGLQNKQIADICGIHIRTVAAHARSAKKKLGGKTTTHAIARAIRDGIIGAGQIGVVLLLCWGGLVNDAEVRSAPRPPTARTSRVRYD
ncbi:TMhelix containing protein [Vibrio phage 1.052.A._10N.286.46.C3]|nr:TMhelix containing protein [Vibrio phage 1.052.A._10N.286.46.C3]